MVDTSAGTLTALSNAVRPVSPSLANALTGPSAGIAVAALGRALLQDVQAAPDAVLTAVQKNDPTMPNQIIAAEQYCQLRLGEGGSGLAQLAPEVATSVVAATVQGAAIDAQDTQNARDRQIRTHDQTTAVLAYAVTGGFFGLLVVLMFFGNRIDGPYKDLLFTLLGVVGTGWANIMGFYFGSSVGSAQKTQALTAVLAGIQSPPDDKGNP